MTEERALAFRCEEDWLYGVASLPQQPCTRGVLIVVGGPQYRAGSHRQFALLARALTDQGIAALRFDYRGMGDSQGEPRSFESVDADLRAALDAFFAAVPGLREVALWGLCDGASAALFYAAQDARVTGVALLNPWVRTEQGMAKATIKHYYRARLFDPTLWRKLLAGRFQFRAALSSLRQLMGSAQQPAASSAATLPERMRSGLEAFNGKVLLITSGKDLTAREFDDMAAASPAWKRLLGAARVTRHRLGAADHTFSRRAWRDQVAAWTAQWVRTW